MIDIFKDLFLHCFLKKEMFCIIYAFFFLHKIPDRFSLHQKNAPSWRKNLSSLSGKRLVIWKFWHEMKKNFIDNILNGLLEVDAMHEEWKK